MYSGFISILTEKEESMEKETFRVLDYIDANGYNQSLNFECNTPHILISGDRIDDILSLENKMLKNLSDSNGKEVNLVVIDDKNVLPDDFFKGHEFNDVSTITEKEAIGHLDRLIMPFLERFLFIYRNEEKTFTDLNESGKEHLKMLVYFFPVLSEDKDFQRLMGKSVKATDAGVHIIAGLDFMLEKPHFLKGCDVRFSFPSVKASKDMKFFGKRKYELPKTGDLWFRNGIDAEVLPISLK